MTARLLRVLALCALGASVVEPISVETSFMWFCTHISQSPVYYHYGNEYFRIRFNRELRNEVDVKQEAKTQGHGYLQANDELFYAVKYDHYVTLMLCQMRPARKFDYAMVCETRQSTGIYMYKGVKFAVEVTGDYAPGKMQIRGLQRGSQMAEDKAYLLMTDQRYGVVELTNEFRFYMCDALPVYYQGDKCDPKLNIFNLTNVELQNYADFKSCPLYLPMIVVAAVLAMAVIALALVVLCLCLARCRSRRQPSVEEVLPKIPQGYKIVAHS